MTWVLWVWVIALGGWVSFPQRYDNQNDCITAGIVLDQKNNGTVQFDCRVDYVGTEK